MAEARTVSTGTTTAISESASKVLRNTYALLAMTVAFSAVTAGYAMLSGAGPMNVFVFLIGAYGLLFLTHFTANSAWGLLSVFAFTGFMGYNLGPILGMYMAAAGYGIVVNALGLTALAFFGLSAVSATTSRDFSFLGKFIAVGFFVLLGAMIAGIFFQIPALQLAISAGFVVFASAAILYQTSAIVHGGEDNYIRATVTLYVSIYNLLMSLLHLLYAFGGDE